MLMQGIRLAAKGVQVNAHAERGQPVQAIEAAAQQFDGAGPFALLNLMQRHANPDDKTSRQGSPVSICVSSSSMSSTAWLPRSARAQRPNLAFVVKLGEHHASTFRLSYSAPGASRRNVQHNCCPYCPACSSIRSTTAWYSPASRTS